MKSLNLRLNVVSVRIMVALILLGAAAMGMTATADEKKEDKNLEKYPLKLKYEEIDAKTGKVTRTVEGVAAERRGDPAKKDRVIFDVYVRSLQVQPEVGSRFIDESGTKWKIKTVVRSQTLPEWRVECTKP